MEIIFQFDELPPEYLIFADTDDAAPAETAPDTQPTASTLESATEPTSVPTNETSTPADTGGEGAAS